MFQMILKLVDIGTTVVVLWLQPLKQQRLKYLF